MKAANCNVEKKKSQEPVRLHVVLFLFGFFCTEREKVFGASFPFSFALNLDNLSICEVMRLLEFMKSLHNRLC